MDRASKILPAGALLGTVALALGVALPHSAPRASSNVTELGLLNQGLGCDPTETPVGTDASGLFARVRAEPAKVRPAERHGPPRKAPRSAAKAPQAEQEPRAAVLRTFYTCQAASAPNPAEGTGWRLVGPLRQG